MTKRLVCIILIAISYTGYAHPGIGIVKDTKGNIFYTDLKQVWRIAPDGKRTIVVANVHTHELFMDTHDNLYGEHLWYNGEKLNTWGHYAWRLQANGKLDTVINPAEGFLGNYSFVRDAAGNMYWAERFKVTRFKKKTTEGKIISIAEGKFKDVRWMYANSNGVVYFIDQLDLYKIEPGKSPQLVAEDISSGTTLLGQITDSRHMLMGIWTDKDDNIYVANYSGQVVKKIGIDGVVAKIAFSTTPWSPTGGVFDEKGNLWLLEYSVTNDARVRKIYETELGKEGNIALRQFNNNILPILIILGVAVVTVLLIGIAAQITKAKLSC